MERHVDLLDCIVDGCCRAAMVLCTRCMVKMPTSGIGCLHLARVLVDTSPQTETSSVLARNAAIARDLGSVWDSTSIWTETPSLLMGNGSIDGGLIPVYETSDGNVVNVGGRILRSRC